MRYATLQKVINSNPDEVIRFFFSLYLICRTIALGLTQPLTEIRTRNLPEVGGVKGLRRVRLTTSPPSLCRFSKKKKKYKLLDASQHHESSRPVTGIASLY
jgi:hypothetical protein